MRAINATVFPSTGSGVWNLDARSGELDRSYIKRNERRLQRRALRAELSSVVVSEMLAEPVLRLVRTDEPLQEKQFTIRLIKVVRKRAFQRPVAEMMPIAA
jgi:hypothetical protein